MYIFFFSRSIYGNCQRKENYVYKYKQGLKQLETGFVCNGEEFITSGEIHEIKNKYNIIPEELNGKNI